MRFQYQIGRNINVHLNVFKEGSVSSEFKIIPRLTFEPRRGSTSPEDFPLGVLKTSSILICGKTFENRQLPYC